MHEWSNSFNKNDEKSCDYEFYNLVGFERDGTDNLQGIKKAKCCERDRTFWNQPTQCQMPDWIRSLDGWILVSFLWDKGVRRLTFKDEATSKRVHWCWANLLILLFVSSLKFVFFLCLPFLLSVHLPACLPACMSVCLSVCLSICLSVCPSVFLSVSLSACLVCLFLFCFTSL